jgi:hypothetical protein
MDNNKINSLTFLIFLRISLCLNFFHLLVQKPNLEKNSMVREFILLLSICLQRSHVQCMSVYRMHVLYIHVMNMNFSQAFELDKLMLKGIVLQTSATEREERLKHLLFIMISTKVWVIRCILLFIMIYMPHEFVLNQTSGETCIKPQKHFI